MEDFLFERDGALFVPSPLTRGPWSADAQHGGPPSALIAHAIGNAPSEHPMRIARLTVELIRPVPLVPLSLAIETLRPGRKVDWLGAELRADDKPVARATALRIREKQIRLPDGVRYTEHPPGPELGTASQPPERKGEPQADIVFHRHAVEHRQVAGSFMRPGAAVNWVRLNQPVVAGEPVHPMSRVAAAADFGNGVSWVLSREDGYQYINPDLTMHVHRYPAGEWVCINSRTYAQDSGVGLAESALFDEQGALGRSLQSLMLDQA